MKKTILVVLIGLLLVGGISLMLYPTLSDLWNKNNQSLAAQEYRAAVKAMSKEERQAMWAAAEDYNRRLYEQRGLASVSEALRAEYPGLLNIDGKGMMGILEIPKIKVCLPLRHTTEDKVLQDSVGHVETSSLPVGGANAHCILSGHTGLPSARLLTDLEQLQVGDEFTLEILGVRRRYEVDQILVVLPWELDALEIEAGQDYCTLVTCTPYGVNSHRLLVRGVHTGDG